MTPHILLDAAEALFKKHLDLIFPRFFSFNSQHSLTLRFERRWGISAKNLNFALNFRGFADSLADPLNTYRTPLYG
jgi:hypothetical protein